MHHRPTYPFIAYPKQRPVSDLAGAEIVVRGTLTCTRAHLFTPNPYALACHYPDCDQGLCTCRHDMQCQPSALNPKVKNSGEGHRWEGVHGNAAAPALHATHGHLLKHGEC